MFVDIVMLARHINPGHCVQYLILLRMIGLITEDVVAIILGLLVMLAFGI